MENFITDFIENFKALDWREWAAVIFGIFYILLVLRENVWGWFWGILSCTLWAWVSFEKYNLWSDAILNIFYVLMAFVGIYQWKYGSSEKKELPISKLTNTQHLLVVGGSLILAVLLGFIFEKFTPAEKTYLDAFTTALAIFATFMTIQKKLENWIYWIIVDILYVYIYHSQGAVLFMLLFIIYCVIAVKGFIDWRNVLRKTI